MEARSVGPAGRDSSAIGPDRSRHPARTPCRLRWRRTLDCRRTAVRRRWHRRARAIPTCDGARPAWRWYVGQAAPPGCAPDLEGAVVVVVDLGFADPPSDELQAAPTTATMT